MTSTSIEQVSTDREFARSVGISFGTCEMCDLLAIEAARKEAGIRTLNRAISARNGIIQKQRHAIGMWQLATFAAVVMMALFAWDSIYHVGRP